MEDPAGPGRLIQVLVYATSGVVRAGLWSLLESDPGFQVVGAVSGPRELLTRSQEIQVDVVVAHAPDRDDEAVYEVLGAVPATVVLADGSEADQWLELGLRQGGFAILDRDADAGDIRAAVLAASRGLFAAQPGRLATLTLAIAPSPTSEHASETLTPRELEVLTMMAEGVPNKTIAYRLGISDHTVKFHVGSILRKLEAESRTEAVTNGFRRGFITV